MIQVRCHSADGQIYVFDDKAQPKGAKHVYWWSLKDSEMCAFIVDAPFLSGLYLVRSKDELAHAIEKYSEWSQKHLAEFVAEWTTHWQKRNSPRPMSCTKAYSNYSDDWCYSDFPEEWRDSHRGAQYDEYNENDMPSVNDGYGDTGEGGWSYDDI